MGLHEAVPLALEKYTYQQKQQQQHNAQKQQSEVKSNVAIDIELESGNGRESNEQANKAQQSIHQQNHLKLPAKKLQHEEMSVLNVSKQQQQQQQKKLNTRCIKNVHSATTSRVVVKNIPTTTKCSDISKLKLNIINSCRMRKRRRKTREKVINSTIIKRSILSRVQEYSVKWLKKISTTLLCTLYFLSLVSQTPANIYATALASTVIPMTTVTPLRIITTTKLSTAAAISVTSVLLNAPYIAASSLRRTTNENVANYQQQSSSTVVLTNMEELVVAATVVASDNDDEESVAVDIDVDVNQLQENSNEQQLLAYYQRAQMQQQHQQHQQQQQQQQQQLQNEHKSVIYNNAELRPKTFQYIKRTDTKRSVSPITLKATTTTTTTTKTTTTTAAETATITSKFTKTQNQNTSNADVTIKPPIQILSNKIPMALVSLSSVVLAEGSLSIEEPTEEKCEPKVLDEVPMEPFFDFSDIVKTAAHQFTEFLSTSKFPSNGGTISDELRKEVRRRANIIAGNALDEDDNLLAFAIAAPQMHTVVVKFKDNVTIPPEEVHNKDFLGSYWRVLGQAWNGTENLQEWAAPFRDCNLLKGRWLWPFRISYTEFKIKIVAAVFIAADEDVCNDGLEDVFGRRHGCDRNTTFCLLMENKPLPAREVYNCICRDSYYLPNSTLQGFRGDLAELSEGYENYSCIPCPGGCTICDKDGECLFGEPQEAVSMENLFKVTVGIILGACIFCCFVFSIIVFRQRKSKAVASSMWTVLQTILLGIVLLYVSVAVHFFEANAERCLAERWLRELGFITCYGAIILKIYRYLVDFRTRKAHRWVLRDVDLLKYLGTMVFAVICYMAAFTASSLDLLETAHCLEETLTNTCHPLKWEYVTQASEMLILCFGLHLCCASRNANTQFRERQFLVVTLVIEFVTSSTFYILRYIYLEDLSPDAMFLALFLRSQLTNTVALGLIFVPKLWYQHKQVRSLAHDLSIRLPVDAFKGSHDVGQRLGGGYAGLNLGDPDIGELTISEMSPEDIRAELKRLYTQLEILKNKTLRQDNPHISKRRGGRKTGHRRFSLQALSSKHRSNKHHQDVEITEAEPSRTPEDSVCSAEGPTDTFAEISGISHSMVSHSVISQAK